jgi:hypothetical protein
VTHARRFLSLAAMTSGRITARTMLGVVQNRSRTSAVAGAEAGNGR